MNLLLSDLQLPSPRHTRPAYAWHHYLRLPELELAKIDIAAMNLQCALGLPGSERIDVAGCLRTIAGWVPVVERWTAAAFDQYFRRDPGQFRNSEVFFRLVALVTALQRHCGVRYDPAKAGVGPDAPYDFDEQFIHGIIQGAGGTCATLPVIFASVGRRLGYPIKLVCTKRHLFCRWDDPQTGERWNIEGTSTEEGFASHSDDHYRRWPVPIKDAEEERAFGYLKSMTPREELANFIGQRGFVLKDLHRYREAVEVLVQASELTPNQATYPGCILSVLREWKVNLQKRLPKSFPKLELLLRPDQRRFPSIPWEIEREYAGLDSLDDILNDPDADRPLWQPLREGRHPLVEVPEKIVSDYTRASYP